MKVPILFGLLAALSLCGCNSSSDTASNTSTNASSGGSVLTAPVDYLRAAGNAQKTAVKTVETASLNQAVQRFAVDKGRNPTDLNELVQQKYIPQLPAPPVGMKFAYDPDTGTVSVVKQ